METTKTPANKHNKTKTPANNHEPSKTPAKKHKKQQKAPNNHEPTKTPSSNHEPTNTPSNKRNVSVGRVVVLVLVGISMLWLPVLEEVQGGRLWDYLLSIAAYFVPPWAVVFVLAVFWTRTTEKVLPPLIRVTLYCA
jgi:hypothetical protein